MSYHIWSTNGVGFSVDEIKTTTQRIESLLRYAPNFNAEVKNNLKESGVDTPKLDDYLDYDQDYYSGLAYIIQSVIYEAEDVRLEIADHFDGEWYVLLCPSYPWADLTQKERYLTMDSLVKMFKKYIGVLTDSPVDIGYQSVENGG